MLSVRTIKVNFAMVSHYLNNRNIKNSFETDEKSHLVCFDLMFPFRPKFCKFFSLIERWEPLTHFSATNLLSICNYIFKKWVIRWNF